MAISTPAGPTQSNWGEDIKGAVQAALHVATGLTNFLPALVSGGMKAGATGLAESVARANVERDRRSRGVPEKLPNDPWGRPYQFANPGVKGPIDVFSYGADGQAGGEGKDADIGSWQ